MARTQLVLYPDAEDTVLEIAAPALDQAAPLIAESIVEQVPVNQGVAKESYQFSAERSTNPEGDPQVRLHVGSPFWHFLEYGTRFNSPYRPVQRGVEALGLRYEPK